MAGVSESERASLGEEQSAHVDVARKEGDRMESEDQDGETSTGAGKTAADGGGGGTKGSKSTGKGGKGASAKGGAGKAGKDGLASGGSGGAGSGANPTFPLARVSRIVKADRDIETTSKDAIWTIAVATELFIKHLTDSALARARLEKKKTITYKELANAVESQAEFFFLQDVIPQAVTIEKAFEQRKELEEENRARAVGLIIDEETEDEEEEEEEEAEEGEGEGAEVEDAEAGGVLDQEADKDVLEAAPPPTTGGKKSKAKAAAAVDKAEKTNGEPTAAGKGKGKKKGKASRSASGAVPTSDADGAPLNEQMDEEMQDA